MTRREDPYQARARELCLAAGFDPDRRVEHRILKQMKSRLLNLARIVRLMDDLISFR